MGCPRLADLFWAVDTSDSGVTVALELQEIYAERGYAETRFNVVKTWTEYFNRLVGATIGLLIFATAWISWPLRKYDRSIAIASIAAFFMVGFQGWLGAKVVGSNLQPGMITIHMLMALAIVGVLIFAMAQARRGIMESQPISSIDPHFEKLLYAVLSSLCQIAMGTQVREMTDYIVRFRAKSYARHGFRRCPGFSMFIDPSQLSCYSPIYGWAGFYIDRLGLITA